MELLNCCYNFGDFTVSYVYDNDELIKYLSTVCLNMQVYNIYMLYIVIIHHYIRNCNYGIIIIFIRDET